MSSQSAAIRPVPVASQPGVTLVQRIGAPVAVTHSYWLRVLPRLCLYALPGIWGMLLQALVRASVIRDAQFAAHLHFLQVFFFVWIGAIECFQAARCDLRNREHTGAMTILKSVLAATGASAVLLHLLGLATPGAITCTIDAVIFLVASVAIKISFRALYDARRPLTRLLVVVADTLGETPSWKLMRKEVSNHTISGAILLEDAALSSPSVVMCSTEELVRAIRREGADGILISAPENEISALSQRIEAGGGLGAPVCFVVGLLQGSSVPGDVSDAESLYLLNAGVEPALTINYTFLKRAFDIVFSIFVLVAGMPLLLLIALLVKVTSNGTIFFIQDRIGWNGCVFRMYKFRTMHTAPAAETDTRWASPNDPHRTLVGKLLRKFSLDELPQFFNVLKGDMSVVGPRPERPFFVSSFRRQIDEYHRRHLLKVGITGWAQVNGLRGDTSIRTRLLYDLYYLQNWGLIFDLKIILKTIFCVFKGTNAY